MIELELKEEEISALLDRLQRSLTDMSPVMNSIGEQLECQTEQRFEQGVSPGGTPWAPRSAATIAVYERRGPSRGCPARTAAPSPQPSRNDWRKSRPEIDKSGHRAQPERGGSCIAGAGLIGSGTPSG